MMMVFPLCFSDECINKHLLNICRRLKLMSV